MTVPATASEVAAAFKGDDIDCEEITVCIY